MLKLDAVNACLEADGLSPVASLDATGDPQVTRAINVVDRVSEQVQLTGWSANTDFQVALALDSLGRIPLPANTLSVSARYYSAVRRVSVRKDFVTGVKYLWNVFDQTFTFSDPLTVDIVYLLDFDDLSVQLQHYVAARAAARYQGKTLGSIGSDKFATREEQESYVALVDTEADAETLNVLLDSDFCAAIAQRNDDFF